MHTVGQDLRYALRQLRRSPAFTVVAIVTLGLGIGANSAMFSVVNGVLFNPLPFSRPNELVALHENKPNFQGGSISYLNFRDWQRDNRTFSAMAVARSNAFDLTGSGEAEQVNGEYISADFFRLLGVEPLLGRNFAAGEDLAGAAPLVQISEGFWKRKLGGRSDVLGQSITLDGRSYTIVGVIPAGFHLRLPSFDDVPIYLPIGQWNHPLLNNRGAGLGIHGIGRLKPTVTLQQAQADMERVSRNLAAAYPESDRTVSANIVPLKTQMVGRARPFLLLLLAAVGFVLLIACVNVANLLLARSTTRSREFAIRIAVGAGQMRLLRQLLTESLLLALAGGALGLLLAHWGVRAALAVLPAALPRAQEISVDPRVAIFTAALTLLVGLVFGFAPAWRARKLGTQAALKEGGHIAAGTQRTQNAFVVVEVATALVLLIGAGLMIRSLARLVDVDPGFNPKNVLSFGLSLPPAMMDAKPDALRAAFRDLDRQLAATPGVKASSLMWGAIPMGSDDEQLFWFAGQPKPAQNDMNWAIDYIVGPDYLKVMEVPLLRGRFFTAHDDEMAPHVAVVDEVFAHHYFPHEDALGKRLNLDNGAQVEIVGVVGHVKQWGLDVDDNFSVRAELYLPSLQVPDSFLSGGASGNTLVVRGEAGIPLSTVFDSIRQTSKRMSADQVLFGQQTLSEMIAVSLAARRFLMVLLVSFAALAMLLSVVGIYGVISYLVARRTPEIGIRMALGADRARVMRLVLGDGLRLALIGVGAGIVAALGSPD